MTQQAAKFQPGAIVLMHRYGADYRVRVDRVNSGIYHVTYYSMARGRLVSTWTIGASLRPDPDHRPRRRRPRPPAMTHRTPLSAKGRFKQAYSAMRSGREFSLSELLMLGHAATRAAREAVLSRDGRHDPAPLPDRLAQHKEMKAFFPQEVHQ